MEQQPYGSVTPDALIVRDHLAVERTVLANERTLLAYIRTSLAFLITGGSLMHVIEGRPASIGGWVFIVAGAATMIFGLRRAHQVARALRRLR
jgi:putative membrane protein